MRQPPITSGPIIHHPTYPLRILGGDPGGDTGLALVEFTQRQRYGQPLWLHATLIAAEVVSAPARKGATHAELDIIFRRRIAETIRTMACEHIDRPEVPIDIVALEEPLDGMARWAGQQRGKKGVEQRGSGFRLGAHYGALLAACATAAGANRYISFPTKTHHTRRGWMQGGKTRRGDTLRASDALLRGICGAHVSYLELHDKKGNIPEHLLMALGVVNHVVEYYLDYFPKEQP